MKGQLKLKPAVVSSKSKANNKGGDSASFPGDKEAFQHWHQRMPTPSIPSLVDPPTDLPPWMTTLEAPAATGEHDPGEHTMSGFCATDSVTSFDRVSSNEFPFLSGGGATPGEPKRSDTAASASVSDIIRACASTNHMIPLAAISLNHALDATVKVDLSMDGTTVASGSSPQLKSEGATASTTEKNVASTTVASITPKAFDMLCGNEATNAPQQQSNLIDAESDEDELLLPPEVAAEKKKQRAAETVVENLDGLRAAIDHVWFNTHDQSSLELEALRRKLSNALAQECVAYANDVKVALDDADKMKAALWTNCLPIPHFSKSPFGEQLVRLIRWLNSWKTESDRVPEPMEVYRAEEEEERRILIEGEDGGGFIVNDRGLRSSLRQKRKEALERQREEEEERQRQAQKGYFGKASTDEGVGSLSNLAVITGACGIGKTALVETAAKMAGYRILEINTAMRRCPKTIEKLFAEATQTHQIKINKGTNSSDKVRLELEKMRSQMAQEQAAAAEKARREAAATAAAAAAVAEKKVATANDTATKPKRGRPKKDATKIAGEKDKEAEKDTGKPPAATAPKKASGKGVKKKPNTLSKETLANFFKPRVKAPPPPDAEVLDVDEGVTTKPLAAAPPTTDGEEKHDPEAQQSAAAVCSVDAKQHVISIDSDDDECILLDKSKAVVDVEEIKRTQSEDVVVVSQTPVTKNQLGAKRSREMVDIDDEDTRSPQSGRSPVAADAPPPPKYNQNTSTLVLVESGDILFDDEHGFYPTLRRMAEESKFPVIITANEFTAAQVCSHFGANTPQADMQPPELLFTALQFLVILAVQRGLHVNHSSFTEAVAVTLAEEVLRFVKDVAEVYHQEEGDIRSLMLNFQLRTAVSDPRLVMHAPEAIHSAATSEEERFKASTMMLPHMEVSPRAVGAKEKRQDVANGASDASPPTRRPRSLLEDDGKHHGSSSVASNHPPEFFDQFVALNRYKLVGDLVSTSIAKREVEIDAAFTMATSDLSDDEDGGTSTTATPAAVACNFPFTPKTSPYVNSKDLEDASAVHLSKVGHRMTQLKKVEKLYARHCKEYKGLYTSRSAEDVETLVELMRIIKPPKAVGRPRKDTK